MFWIFFSVFARPEVIIVIDRYYSVTATVRDENTVFSLFRKHVERSLAPLKNQTKEH